VPVCFTISAIVRIGAHRGKHQCDFG
jgi:hypothetical protein